jgi:ArsR family transcriptional regulator
MNSSAATARRILACLGDASRFKLVSALLEGERCVTEIASEIGLSQSCTTRHLQALEREGIVRGTRDGKRVLYRVRSDEPRVRELLEWAASGSRAGARRRPGERLRRQAPRRAPDRGPGGLEPESWVRQGSGPPPGGHRSEPVDAASKRPEALPERATPPPGDGPAGAGYPPTSRDMEDWLL